MIPSSGRALRFHIFLEPRTEPNPKYFSFSDPESKPEPLKPKNFFNEN